MASTDLQSSRKKIERYLFAEMSENEREKFEESFFLDDALFYEIADLENEFADQYAEGKLTGKNLKRFEKSLEKFPERRKKAANARALQTFIAEERPNENTKSIAGEKSFPQKFADFFTIKTRVYGFAMSGLLILFAIGLLILFFNNQRKTAQLARLENQQQQFEQFQTQKEELHNQIEAMRGRENELQNRIDDERETSGDLTDELQRERQERQKLEAELEKIKNKINLPPSPQTAPVITTILLRPAAAIRGGQTENVQTLDIERGTKRVSVLLELPAGIDVNERFSVRLNDKIAARNLKPRLAPNRQKSIQITISAEEFSDKTNQFTIFDSSGAEIKKYNLKINRK